MSSLVDIGISAVVAYRTALTATSENIANVDTEGFARRDVTVGEVLGGQTTPTTLNSGSQGVQVQEIKRAFDGFLAERVRSTTSNSEAAQTFQKIVASVEDLFLPEGGGIAEGFEGFFDALSTLSGNPSDMALRQGTIEAGRAMASSLADVAAGLVRLREDAFTQAQTAAEMFTARLQDLKDLQDRLSGATNSNGGLNALYDERDRLLGEIAELAGTTTTLNEFGRATVKLGATAGGPLLLDGMGATYVEVNADEDMRYVLLRDGVESESTQFSGGVLTGYRQAIGAIDDAILQLNALAQRVANDVNALHGEGVDLHGNTGGEFFILEGWKSTAANNNRGSAFVDFMVTDRELANELGPITLVRDAVAGDWIAQDELGTEITRGASMLLLDGLTVTITGAPANGDRLTIQSVQGRAIDMALAFTDTDLIAAAGATLVSPASTNTGTATAVMANVPVAAPAVDDLADVLTTTGSGADAVSLLSSGVVGYVPAGATSLNLAAMGTQSTFDFAVSDAQAAAAGTLGFSIGGTAYSFDLSAVGAATAADLATALNNGSVTAATGETFAELGVHAAGTSGAFSISLGNGDFDAGATLTTGAGSATGALTTATPAGGTIQIFTRNGVQIAGTQMTATEAATLMTTANGFLAGATYIPDYLYGTEGYRGAAVTQTTIPGAESLSLPLSNAATWTVPATAAANPASSMTVTDGAGVDTVVAIPTGATAKRVETLLNDALDGINADAETTVALTASADGTVSFRLAGRSVSSVQITGNVTGGRMDSVAQAINAAVGATGITASLSPEGDRIMLRSADGENIEITSFTHSTGGTLTATPTNADGTPSAAGSTLGAGVDSVRVTGRIEFTSSDGFGVAYNAALVASSADPMAGGLITRTTSSAGSVQSYAFDLSSEFDTGAASTDGLVAQAPGATFTMTVGGRTVSYTGVDPAAGLAAALRADAPQSTLTGGPVATPAEGAATTVLLGEDVYTLRMTGGSVVVTGPEEGRLSAAFDGTGRLQISVTDGSLDGAALRVQTGATGAALFGLAPANSPTSTITGQPVNAAALPATMQVEVAGTSYNIAVTAGSVTPAGGFPGTATISGGIVSFDFPSGTGPVRIPQSAAAEAAGFATMDMEARVTDDGLTLTSTSGAVVDADIDVQALASQRISITDLPPEDLIIVMTGSGTLRLGGSYEAGDPPDVMPSTEVEVMNADTGLIRLRDKATGQTIAQTTLDASGNAILGGVQIGLSGNAATGDVFSISANFSGINDGRTVNALSALRSANPSTGKGGFGQILAALQGQKGAIVSAANSRVTVTDAARDSAERVYADRAAVDLDTEAARLLEQQQAYQAAAQILSVASDLFDTLINAL